MHVAFSFLRCETPEPVDDYGDDYGLRYQDRALLSSFSVLVAVVVRRCDSGVFEMCLIPMPQCHENKRTPVPRAAARGHFGVHTPIVMLRY